MICSNKVVICKSLSDLYLNYKCRAELISSVTCNNIHQLQQSFVLDNHAEL